MYKYRDKQHVKYDLCKLIDLKVGDKLFVEPPISLYYLRNITLIVIMKIMMIMILIWSILKLHQNERSTNQDSKSIVINQ